ncbi:MAG: hypothetical protein JWL90_4320 [Chthoniobacteraceae bacterium]|nr:hypothetical protein [Chthoniobacteraceae bacterium]
MIPKYHPALHRNTLAAALLAGSALAGLAGDIVKPADGKETKAVIEKAPEANPLCFLDGRICFDVQERLRIEVRNNNFDFDDSLNSFTDDTWLLQRFRVGVLVKATPWLRIYAQGQDSREFESDRPNIPGALAAEGDDNFDLRQAYFEIGDPKSFPLTLKAGRQLLSYGDERLIGGFDWNNFGRTFDAAKLSWKAPTWQLDLFASSVVVIKRDEFNKSDLFNGNENDREQIFSGAYFTMGDLAFGSLELYALWLSQANGTTASLQGAVPTIQPKGAGLLAQHSSFGTYGGRVKGDPKKLHGFEFEVEGAYQNGEVFDQALSAFAVHAGAGYNFDSAWKPRLWAEYNFATGDKDPADNDSETFQNLFPTNHKFYGIMDLFSWQNMHNPMISLRVSPVKSVTAQLDYHAFWLASTDDFWYRANGLTPVRPLTPAARNASNFAGQEVDFVVTWNATKRLQVQAGYSHFFAGSYLADTGPSDDADFGYLQATINF